MIMKLNKNKIFGYAALLMLILGACLSFFGFFIYREFTIGFCIAGFGFFVISWTFNALKGRI